MKPEDNTLDDKYSQGSGRIFLTGTQALARLPMLQRDRGLAAALNTAGYISAYCGSPLGGLDQALWKTQNIAAAGIKRRALHDRLLA